MTRNRELDLEDLYGCDHEPEIGVSEGSEIVACVCRCGQVKRVATKRDEDAEDLAAIEAAIIEQGDEPPRSLEDVLRDLKL